MARQHPRRARRDVGPELLIERALALLAQAGALPEPLLTPREAAELVPIGVEAVRVWCRDGRVGFFDRRLRTFLIPLDQLRSLCSRDVGF
jgi:hypothetical protein